MKIVKFNKKAYEVDEEKFNRNTREELNKDVSLKEIKGMIGSTKGYKKAPSAKLLRCFSDIVAAGTLSDCRMEVYSCGFAVYQAVDKAAVLRMESVGHVHYEADPVLERGVQDIDLLETSWMVAVMMRGEDLLEQYQQRRVKETIIYSSDMEAENDDEDLDEHDIDAGIDVEGEVLDRMEVRELLSLLTQRQCECLEMYCGLGMTQQEIAKNLGIRQPNVSKALRKSLQCAKEILNNF